VRFVVLAHVVSPGGPPLYASWLASLALFGGAFAAFVWWREPSRRAAFVSVGGVGLVASGALLVVQPSAPLRPGYGIQLAGPRQGAATSPVVLRVCAVDAVVSPAPVPGPGRLLLVSVDGRQVAEVRASTVTVSMSAGEHRVAAQLITSDHRAFVPPITASTTVTVGGPGPIQTPPTCGP
jgi:hypothetical protein